MNKSTTAFILAAAVMGLVSCHKIIGHGPVVTDTRSTGEFSAINFGVPGDLRFIPSDHYEIVIEAQRNIADAIETYVSGDELKVKVRHDGNIRSSEEIIVTVKAPSVHSLSLSGSGNLKVMNTFKPASAHLTVSGSGSMTIDRLETNDAEVTISGSGRIQAHAGVAGEERLAISGSGDVDFLGVEAAMATTRTSGSGTIRLSVSDNLDARISGSGDVFYRGTPVVNTSISGSGRVLRLN